MKTPTITQMLPHSMKVEFFRRVMKNARYRVRSGLIDWLLRLTRSIDKKSARAREASKSRATY